MKPVYLFTYGTLMSGFNNSMALYLRKNAQLIAKAYFNGLMFDLGSYPGAIYESDTTHKVHGEVYQLLTNNDVIFEILDVYEGINDPYFNLYERKVIPVNVNNNVYNNFVYLLRETPRASIIDSGDYNFYINNK